MAPHHRNQKSESGNEDFQEVNNAQEDYGIYGLPICQSEDEDYDDEDYTQYLSLPGTPTTPLNGPISPLAKHKARSKSGSTSSHRSSCSSQHSDGTDDLHNNTDNKDSRRGNGGRLSIDLFSLHIVDKMVKLFSQEPAQQTTSISDAELNDKSGKLTEYPGDVESGLDEFNECSDCSYDVEDMFDTVSCMDVENKVCVAKKKNIESDKDAVQSVLDESDNLKVVENTSTTEDTNKIKASVSETENKLNPKLCKKSISGKIYRKKKQNEKNKSNVRTKYLRNLNRRRLSIDLLSLHIVGKMVKLFNNEPGQETTYNPDAGYVNKHADLAEHPEDKESELDELYELSDCSSDKEDTFDTDPSKDMKNKVGVVTQESFVCDKDVVQSESGKLDVSTAKEETIDIKVRDPKYFDMYWSQLPRVQESGILASISSNDIKHQEAMFEIIKSEETHLINLNNFIRVYLSLKEFGRSEKPILSAADQKVLFSNITAIRDTSEKFLAELETKWQTSGLLLDIFDTIQDFATNHFSSYIIYCSNMPLQDKKLEELKKNAAFMEVVKRLQTHKACKRLPLESFLVLPMQRITRLPLLVSAVLKYINPVKQPRQYEAGIYTLDTLNSVVTKCNEGAKKAQQAEEIFLLSKQIVFKDVPPVTIMTSSRYLVKKGSLSWLPLDKSMNLTLMNKKLYLILFNDLLLLTKKDGDRYMVIDYAERPMLHVEMFDEPDKRSTSGLNCEAQTKFLPPGIPNYCVYPILLIILENCKQKRMEYLLDCTTENGRSDRERWLEALRPVCIKDTKETIYIDWDCPQVLCLRRYEAKEPDELTLEESDVVKVLKKVDDGMYEGERLRDDERGWFPHEYTVEVNDAHVRARNLRMQYMLANSRRTKNC